MKNKKSDYPLLSKIEFFCSNSLIPETATPINSILVASNKDLLMDTFQTGKVPFLKKSTFTKNLVQTWINYPDQENFDNHFEIWLDYGIQDGHDMTCYCFTYYIQRI